MFHQHNRVNLAQALIEGPHHAFGRLSSDEGMTRLSQSLHATPPSCVDVLILLGDHVHYTPGTDLRRETPISDSLLALPASFRSFPHSRQSSLLDDPWRVAGYLGSAELLILFLL
jgi:hypothetical protein